MKKIHRLPIQHTIVAIGKRQEQIPPTKKIEKRAMAKRKMGQRRAKMAPLGAKNGPKKGRRECKNDTKPPVELGSASRPPQGRPGPPPGVAPPTFPSLLGDHLGTPKRPKTDPKTIKNRSEKEESTKSDPRGSRTRLGAILVPLGAPCGSPKAPKVLENVLFRAQSLFRR